MTKDPKKFAPKGNAPKKRKNHSNSTSRKNEIAQAANREILPPENFRFRKKDWNNFDIIIEQFPRLEWTSYKIALAAQLAQAMTEREKEADMMRREGAVLKKKSIVRGKGDEPDKVVTIGTYTNPRKSVIESWRQEITQLTRMLGLNVQATGETTKDRRNRINREKKIEEGFVSDPKISSLFATPIKS
jgi:hypothetical protein